MIDCHTLRQQGIRFDKTLGLGLVVVIPTVGVGGIPGSKLACVNAGEVVST